MELLHAFAATSGAHSAHFEYVTGSYKNLRQVLNFTIACREAFISFTLQPFTEVENAIVLAADLDPKIWAVQGIL